MRVVHVACWENSCSFSDRLRLALSSAEPFSTQRGSGRWLGTGRVTAGQGRAGSSLTSGKANLGKDVGDAWEEEQGEGEASGDEGGVEDVDVE